MDCFRMKKFPVAQHRIAGGSTITVWAVLLVLAVGRLIAQTGGTGSILGSVTDSTGAVIPKATVVVTNIATGVKSTVTTTSAGDYTVLSLIPGQYSVLAEAPGFAKTAGHRHHPGCRSTGARQPGPQTRQRERDGYDHRGCRPTRYRQCRDFATCQFAAGDPVAAQRAQFLRSALYRGRRGP